MAKVNNQASAQYYWKVCRLLSTRRELAQNVIMPKNKFFPLKIKMLLALLPLTVFFAFFCFAVIKGGEQLSLTRSLAMRSESLGECLAAMSADSLADPGNYAKSAKLQRNISVLAEQRGVSALEVLNSAGKVKASSLSAEIGSVKNDEQTRKALGLSVIQSGLETSGETECMVSTVPVRSSDSSLGIVRVYLATDELTAAFSGLKRQLLGLVFILISGALGFTAFVSYFYGNPLLNLAEVADQMAQGKLETRADQNRADEIGLAASRLNRLSEYIQKLIASSQAEETEKRERIHALRNFVDGVLAGDTESQAKVEDIDELGQLSMSINELVRHMRTLSAAEQALQDRVNESEHIDVGSCPTIGDLPVNGTSPKLKEYDLSGSSSTPQYYKNRLLPDSETVIAMAAPAPKRSESSQPTSSQPVHKDNQEQGHDNSFVSFQEDYSLAQGGELNNSQLDYVNKLSRLGAGKTALIATGGTEDSYPFLRRILEDEGFSVLYASTIGEMLEITSYAKVDLVMVEFNDMDGGNQHAVNRLRGVPGGEDVSAIVLEATEHTNVPYASMQGVIQIIIPNADDELISMIREALAEIVLTGGSNPFI